MKGTPSLAFTEKEQNFTLGITLWIATTRPRCAEDRSPRQSFVRVWSRKQSFIFASPLIGRSTARMRCQVGAVDKGKDHLNERTWRRLELYPNSSSKNAYKRLYDRVALCSTAWSCKLPGKAASSQQHTPSVVRFYWFSYALNATKLQCEI